MLNKLFEIVYVAVLIGLAIFGAHRCYILYLYFRYRGNVPVLKSRFRKLPKVTVQLPIYNEKYVVERLIDNVCAIDYPKELLHIQVLDDSTDETVDVARAVSEKYRARGFDIDYIHRDDRSGFKAGALREGLKRAKGEFVAIFDADFVPSKRVIKEGIHYFTEKKIGMVQVRWGHLNRNFSLLTKVQSIFLDGHFVIHHIARSRSGKFFNFNGTAGIWRKACIEDAGGWQTDTLTEDMDLSYRAQLRGWKFIYLNDVVSDAELPVEMNAFKIQQHRWAKGAIQTARKVLVPLWKGKWPLDLKLEVTFHLLNNVAYIFSITVSLLLLPAIFIKINLGKYQVLFFDLPILILVTISFWVYYICSQKELYGRWLPGLKYIFMLSVIGIGLSVNNAKAVIDGMRKKQTSFRRTPKYNVVNQIAAAGWKEKNYVSSRSAMSLLEIALGLYFTFLVTLAFQNKMYASVPIFILFQIGFFYVGFLSLFQRGRKYKPLFLNSPS